MTLQLLQVESLWSYAAAERAFNGTQDDAIGGFIT
jgi:hypothetical protein